jgi:hypothetical protein
MVSIGGLVTLIRMAPQRQPPSQGSFQSSIATSFACLYVLCMAQPDNADIYREFARAVNMNAAELEAWLESDESRRVGLIRPGADESVGRASGRHILRILRTPEDYRHMRKVVGFIRRHRAQEPANIVTSRWRYSLMNWGHDPLKHHGMSETSGLAAAARARHDQR